jgi:2-polyprenyl-3-methyl-5-hydroxy-6-metoxy-1,4-benzoquinol methylase
MGDFAGELSERFDAPLSFVHKYLERNFDIPSEQMNESWYEGLSDLQKLHTSYALSTNQRAPEVVSTVARYRKAPIKRHLDIGCGYGGLLRAFSGPGVTSIGIEIDPILAEYSHLNTEGLNVTVHNVSVHDFNFGGAGQFDLVTCTEVIEHVADPEKLIQNIAAVLAPGGTLFLRMPNGRSLNFVREDGHFLLFGICLLSRQEAKAFRFVMTGADDYDHMGEYFGADWYGNLLAENGLRYEMLRNAGVNGAIETVPDKALAAVAAFTEWHATRPDIPYLQRQLLIKRFGDYMECFWHDFAAVQRGHLDRLTFCRRYLDDFWTFLGTKSME